MSYPMIPVTTASNGLTKTANNVALGGSLTGDTTVDLAGHNLLFLWTGGGIQLNPIFIQAAVGSGGNTGGLSVGAGAGSLSGSNSTREENCVVDVTTGTATLYHHVFASPAKNSDLVLDDDGTKGRITVSAYPTSRADAVPTNVLSTDSSGHVRSSSIAQLSTALSDLNAKEAIAPFTVGLAGALQLNPIRFSYKREIPGLGGHREVGLIAQEMMTVFPDAVKYIVQEGMPGLFGIDQRVLPFILLNAVKELAAEVTALKRALEERNELREAGAV